VTAAVIVGAVLAVVALWAAGSGRRRRCRGVAVSRCPAVVAPGRGVRRGARSSGSGRGVRRYRRGVEFRTRPDTGSLLRELDYRNFVTGIQIPESDFTIWVSRTAAAH
jgi:hypothetical protein